MKEVYDPDLTCGTKPEIEKLLNELKEKEKDGIVKDTIDQLSEEAREFVNVDMKEANVWYLKKAWYTLDDLVFALNKHNWSNSLSKYDSFEIIFEQLRKFQSDKWLIPADGLAWKGTQKELFTEKIKAEIEKIKAEIEKRKEERQKAIDGFSPNLVSINKEQERKNNEKINQLIEEKPSDNFAWWFSKARPWEIESIWKYDFEAELLKLSKKGFLVRGLVQKVSSLLNSQREEFYEFLGNWELRSNIWKV